MSEEGEAPMYCKNKLNPNVEKGGEKRSCAYQSTNREGDAIDLLFSSLLFSFLTGGTRGRGDEETTKSDCKDESNWNRNRNGKERAGGLGFVFFSPGNGNDGTIID